MIQFLLKGALDQVKIFRDPNVAAEQCKSDIKVSIDFLFIIIFILFIKQIALISLMQYLR